MKANHLHVIGLLLLFLSCRILDESRGTSARKGPVSICEGKAEPTNCRRTTSGHPASSRQAQPPADTNAPNGRSPRPPLPLSRFDPTHPIRHPRHPEFPPPTPPPATGHDLGPRADFGTILAIHRFQLALRLGGWRKHASKPRSVGLKRGSHRSLHPPPSNFTRPVPCPTCRENARQCSTIGLRQVQPTLRLLAVSLRAAGFNRPRSTPPTAAPSRPYARSISTQGAFLDELPRGHNTKETAKYMGSGRKVCPDWARCANRR